MILWIEIVLISMLTAVGVANVTENAATNTTATTNSNNSSIRNSSSSENDDGMKSMKIVEKPLQLHNNWNSPASEKLTSSTKPPPFTGPAHLRHLAETSCYTLTHDEYRYQLCPFRNVTQHEVSSRWNAYSGVLGVWKDWSIVNGSFAALRYHKGERCGSLERSCEVQLRCGDRNNLTAVQEPQRCAYELVFESPLFCVAMQTYAALKDGFRVRYVHAWQDLADGMLTRKGVDRKLAELYRDAGFVTTAVVTATAGGRFENLATCQKEYLKLLSRVTELERLIKLYS